MTLPDYLRASRPAWDWRTLDCCRWVDRWVQLRGHGSPILALGLDYDSEASAMRCIVKGGGLTALWDAGLAHLGVTAADHPQPGDVGVIRRPTTCRMDEVAAIYTGERWAFLTESGLGLTPADALRAWQV